MRSHRCSFRLRISTGLFGLAAMFGSHAGDRTFDFSQDPASIGIEIKGNNDQPWVSTGGNPGGFLALTYSENSQYAALEFPDIDDGKVVTAFKFTADLRVGNAQGNAGRPADGFSVSFARSNDPLVTGDLANTGGFAGGIPEGGSTTGIAVSFDTWSGNTLPDGPDIEGIIVRVDNLTVNRTSLPVRNGACTDPTSLQTGPVDQAYWDAGGATREPQAWTSLCWQPLIVDLTGDAKLTVSWKGRKILDAFQTSFFPSPGKLILAGRTGGANENTHFDNIRLVTTASAPDNTAPSVPGGLALAGVSTRVASFSWNAATDDSGKVAYEVERDGTVITSSVLTTTSFTDKSVAPNTSYSYKVRSVDPFGNKSAFSAALAVKTEVENLVATPGFLKFETWSGIGSVAVDSLVSDPRYPDSPDFVSYVNAVDSRIAYPDDTHENYGGRMSGTFTATESGQFRFFLRSDDASQLFLSSDENVANLAMIAEETGCCNAFTEPDSPRTSEPVALVAGRKYAFQVLWKEGGGGDFAQVAMRKEGSTTAAGALQPMSGSLFSTPLDPNHGAPLVQESPKSVTVAAGASATFEVKALGKQPFSYQWLRNGAPISGANGASYTVANAGTSNFGSYSVQVSNIEGSATSGTANLVVTGLPTALFIHASAGPNASDLAAVGRIQTLGLQVVPMGALATQTSDGDGKALIVISSTVASGEVGDKFRQSTTPVVNWEAALQDNFDESDRANDADGSTRGVTGGQAQLNIVKSDHPLAAGLPLGPVNWSTGQDVSWGVVGPGAIVIATIVDNPERAAIYAHPVGAKLFDGSTNPGLRVHVPAGDNTFLGLLPDGMKLFDATIRFAANLSDVKPTPTIGVARSGAGLTITYTGTLQSADTVSGPWANVPGASSPHAVASPAGTQKYFRAGP